MLEKLAKLLEESKELHDRAKAAPGSEKLTSSLQWLVINIVSTRECIEEGWHDSSDDELWAIISEIEKTLAELRARVQATTK